MTTRDREPTGCEKLSRLQKVILIMLLDSSYAELSRRDFNQAVYDNFFQENSKSNRASLSRSYRRLEERGLIIRAHGQWQLTDDSGVLMAALALISLKEKIEIDAEEKS